MKYAVIIRDLWFRYEGNDEWALKGINLKVRCGEFVLITGPSGCGKTTLCRCLNGLVPHFYHGDYKGEVLLMEKINARDHEPYMLARYVGMVFQDPESQLIMSDVEREIAFGLENMSLPREEILERIDWALGLLGISHLRYKAPFELSGGEQQKVAIASVIALKPKILVLDEPTANLDPASAKEVLELLQRLRDELGITIILVEHRLDLAAEMVDRVLIMDSGKIIEEGKPEEVLASKEAEKIGIEIPKVVRVHKLLFGRTKAPLTPEELAREILYAIKGDKGREPLV